VAVVVSDTSPIRALAHLDLLELLQILFGDIYLPPAVAHELKEPDSDFPSIEVERFNFLQIRAPVDVSSVIRFREELDPGESEALALAIEIRADAILMDEAEGRSVALREGLVPIGVLGILLRAKRRGRIISIAPLLDRLQSELNFFISTALRDQVLRDALE
jgi:uncharacterized protein